MEGVTADDGLAWVPWHEARVEPWDLGTCRDIIHELVTDSQKGPEHSALVKCLEVEARRRPHGDCGSTPTSELPSHLGLS